MSFIVSLVSKRRLQATTRWTSILALAALAACVISFRDALLNLIHCWGTQEEYSHGYLIPLITAWLLWTRRDLVRNNIGRPHWIGLVLVLLAIALLIVGELSALFILPQLGFVIALFGLVFVGGGYPLFKITFVPIAFLLFAIPLPYFVDAELTLRLQLISSELGVFFIRLFDIPVYLDGNIIDMGTYRLQVVEACSGLRYLYPLLSLSFLAAYLFKAQLWQRIVVFLSSIPIAIGMNGLRIGLVGVLVTRWGTRAAEGVLHSFEGWIIFMACALLLTVEMYVLALISRRRSFDIFYFRKPVTKPAGTLGPCSLRTGLLAAGFLALCASAIAGHIVSDRSEVIPQRMSFVEFPARIGPWVGHTSLLDIATEKALGVDDYILSDYARPNGTPVNLYVAFYASQRSGVSPHSPTVCIPGGGWIITSLREMSFGDGGGQWPFNRVIIEKDDFKQLVYYWFNERGRRLANEYLAKFYLLADAIVKNRTDGALIRLVTRIDPLETEQDADRRIRAFMQDALPKLADFLPVAGDDRGHLTSYELQSHHRL